MREMPLCAEYRENSRGLGLADMARAIEAGRKPRADRSQLLHVLEAMEGFETSRNCGQWVRMESAFERSAALEPCVVKGVVA